MKPPVAYPWRRRWLPGRVRWSGARGSRRDVSGSLPDFDDELVGVYAHRTAQFLAALSGGGGGPYPWGSLYVLPLRFARRGADLEVGVSWPPKPSTGSAARVSQRCGPRCRSEDRRSLQSPRFRSSRRIAGSLRQVSRKSL